MRLAMWSGFQHYIAPSQHCACRPEARLLHPLCAFARDLRQHRERVVSSTKLLLRPGPANPGHCIGAAVTVLLPHAVIERPLVTAVRQQLGTEAGGRLDDPQVLRALAASA
jgi:hypothetical protein